MVSHHIFIGDEVDVAAWSWMSLMFRFHSKLINRLQGSVPPNDEFMQLHSDLYFNSRNHGINSAVVQDNGQGYRTTDERIIGKAGFF